MTLSESQSWLRSDKTLTVVRTSSDSELRLSSANSVDFSSKCSKKKFRGASSKHLTRRSRWLDKKNWTGRGSAQMRNVVDSSR